MRDRAREFALEATAVEDIQKRIDVGPRFQVGDSFLRVSEFTGETPDLGAQQSRSVLVYVTAHLALFAANLSVSGIPYRLSPCQRSAGSYIPALPSGPLSQTQEANAVKAGRDHHGQPVRLGHDEARRRDTGHARHRLRRPPRPRPPHAQAALRVRARRARQRLHGDHRRRGRRRASAGHDGLAHLPARAGRADEHACARWQGFAAVHPADVRAVIIAGAGGAAHLPGMTASLTSLPVLGVPMNTHALDGKDSLLSILQMPGGIPVGTLAIGKPGAINAALLAAAILGLSDPKIAKRLEQWRTKQTKSVSKRPQD